MNPNLRIGVYTQPNVGLEAMTYEWTLIQTFRV